MANDGMIEFGVKALLFNDSTFLALHKTGIASPKYELPGGRMVFGETAEETVVREVFEETGLHVKPLRVIDTWNYIHENRQITGIIYLCEAENIDSLRLSDEHDAYEWLGTDAVSLEKMNRLVKPQMLTWDWDALIPACMTKHTTEIVPVTDDNKREWANLCAELWPHHTADEMLAEMADGGYENEFLYCINGEAAAFVSLSLRNDYVEGTSTRPVGYIEGIYVRPAHRKKGIAKELVAFAGEWSRTRGCRELASDCLLENEASRLFHRRVGFKEANTIVCFTMDI